MNKAELARPRKVLACVVGPLCRSLSCRNSSATGSNRRTSPADFGQRGAQQAFQDLDWRYLLCAACEGGSARQGGVPNIFWLIHERRQDRFRYGPSFARFAVSVAWRALCSHLSEASHLNGSP